MPAKTNHKINVGIVVAAVAIILPIQSAILVYAISIEHRLTVLEAIVQQNVIKLVARPPRQQK